MNLNMNSNHLSNNGSYIEAIILIIIGFLIGIFFIYAVFTLTGTINKINEIHATLEQWELTK